MIHRIAKRKVFDWYATVFARRRFYRIHKGLFYLAARGLGFYNLSSMRLSGEAWILDRLAGERRDVTVFDVGANDGEFTRMVIDRDSERFCVHAFEPNPAAFSRLQQSVGHTPKVRLNAIALGEVDGSATLYDLEGASGSRLASLYPAAVEVAGRRSHGVGVTVRSLDSYCAQNAIDRIDLLKLDTEGHELAVLRGAQNVLASGRIRFVQFEFNEMNVASRSFFADFIRELPNYRFYRLLVDGPVSIQPYAPFNHEIFGYQNILAVHDDAS